MTQDITVETLMVLNEAIGLTVEINDGHITGAIIGE